MGLRAHVGEQTALLIAGDAALLPERVVAPWMAFEHGAWVPSASDVRCAAGRAPLARGTAWAIGLFALQMMTSGAAALALAVAIKAGTPHLVFLLRPPMIYLLLALVAVLCYPRVDVFGRGRDPRLNWRDT